MRRSANPYVGDTDVTWHVGHDKAWDEGYRAALLDVLQFVTERNFKIHSADLAQILLDNQAR